MEKLSGEILDLNNFGFGFPFDYSDYTICNELVKSCGDLSYLPNTKTFVFTNASFCHLVENDMFVNNVSKALGISQGEAGHQIADFFSDKMLLVQQKGVQGYVSKIGTFAQTAGSASMVARTVTMAKVAGVSGLKVVKAQPLLVVALPTVGAMFFYGCGTIVGNNTIGRTCNTIGNVLNLPMRFSEMTYNSYIGPFLHKTIGLPTILNYTQQVKRGPGLDASEALKILQATNNTSILGNIKCFVLERLGGKCCIKY